MILFHAKANGQVTTTPSLVPQGSSMQDLVVLSELDYALCTIKLEPASGLYIPDIVCDFIETVNKTTLWTAKMPPEAAKVPGIVRYQLLFTAADGTQLTTLSGTFNVPRGAITNMPESVEDLEQYTINEIYALLANIYAKVLEGGGSGESGIGNGTVFVKVTTENDVSSASHSSAEIFALLEAGVNVVLEESDTYFQFYQAAGSYAVFRTTFVDSQEESVVTTEIVVDADKNITKDSLTFVGGGTAGGAGGLVTVTIANGTASHSSAEIYDLVQQGYIVSAAPSDNRLYYYVGAYIGVSSGVVEEVFFEHTYVNGPSDGIGVGTEWVRISGTTATTGRDEFLESVSSVNGQTGAVTLTASDVGARDASWMPTAEQVGADPSGTAATAVSDHNTFTGSHNDIRILIQELSDRLNAFFDTDDTTLDELSEIVAYITSNKSLIDSITTSKVSVSDIIDNLTTNVSNKPLSAAQGVALKSLIDALSTGKLDASALTAEKLASVLGYTPANAANVPTTLSQLTDDSTHRTVTDAEKTAWNNKVDASEVAAEVTEQLTQAKENGEFEGKSAYQSAVDSGFKGTEAEWVEAMKTGSGVAKITTAATRYVTPYFSSPSDDDVVLHSLSGYIDAEGNLVAHSTYVCTDYIRINETTQIEYKVLAYNAMCSYAFYDGAMNFLSGLVVSTASSVTSTAGTLTEIPEGAVFVRFTMKETATDQYATVTTTVVTPRDPSALVLPDYWEAYLPDKIDAVKALQTEGGKDAVCFIVITDIHFGFDGVGFRGNQGWSPMMAKRIADECNIKYVLNLGDVFSRYAVNQSKDSAYEELALIKEMLVPIRDRMLITRGNHDVAYGTDFADNFTPNEVHEWFFRPLCLLNGVHFDDSGTGYYVDDTAERVRYIVLNTQNHPDTLGEDGLPKYKTNGDSRFTQSQFDLVTEALQGVPSDSWSVIIASHVPIAGTYGPENFGGTDSDGDGTYTGGEDAVMRGMLEAYRNKTTYAGTFAGTGEVEGGEVVLPYTNLADASNATDSPSGASDERFFIGYRYSTSSGTPSNSSVVTNGVTTNMIRIKDDNGNPIIPSGGYLHVKGLDLKSTCGIYWFNSSKEYANGDGTLASNSAIVVSDYDDSVIKIPYVVIYGIEGYYIKIYSSLTGGAGTQGDVIITIDEAIVEVDTGTSESTEKTYDYVDVNVDFTGAKGDIIAWISGHTHRDLEMTGADWSIKTISNRADACIPITGLTQGVRGTTTEQSFNVYVVNKKTRQIHITKIGAGDDRTISY